MNRKEILGWYAKEFDNLSREISKKDSLSYYDFLRIRNFKLQNSSREKEENIEKITKEAFKLAKEDKIEGAISKLLELHGIGFPIASAILAMRYPEKYAIIDTNVLRGIFSEEKKRIGNGEIKNCKKKGELKNEAFNENIKTYEEYLKFLNKKTEDIKFMSKIKYNKEGEETTLRFLERYYFEIGRNLNKNKKEKIKDIFG